MFEELFNHYFRNKVKLRLHEMSMQCAACLACFASYRLEAQVRDQIEEPEPSMLLCGYKFFVQNSFEPLDQTPQVRIST